MEQEKIIENFIEVKLLKEEDFLKVKETLTRIGVSSKKDKKLYQSCHILHKRGKYYIVHFKELFILDGLASTLTDNDIARRNTIVTLLEQWELVEIVESYKCSPKASMAQIKIIPYSEKNEWDLIAKYSIGH